MKNEKILLNPPRHCLSRPFWHKTPPKVSLPHNDMHYTVWEFSNFQSDCKTSNLKWSFYFWDRIVIPSHYSKLTLRKNKLNLYIYKWKQSTNWPVEFEMNRTWNSWNPTLCTRRAATKNMSKHVITSRDMLCFESRKAEMWWFICRF